MQLHQVKPREQNGRDTFERYRAQTRAAALAALAILEGADVDRVYCDFHDDYVVREIDGGNFLYCFVQVKTKAKANESWALNEVFGLKSRIKDQKKQDAASVASSFVGKLLVHTMNFPDNCKTVTFMTNVHVEDAIEEILSSLGDGTFGNKYAKVLIEKFEECFVANGEKLSPGEIKSKLSKLRFETDVQHIKEKNNNFEPIARDKIHEFSEVDLSHEETREVLVSLLDLVESKSAGVIDVLTASNVDARASVGINDLLDILSISRDAYNHLLTGGDPKAIKSASIMQRVMKAAGADDDEIEFCSRCKTDWDVWLRDNRNKLSEMDIMFITSKMDSVLQKIAKHSDSFRISALRGQVKDLARDLEENNVRFDLSEQQLLGGIFSALVRSR